jgi:hypothetical protein
MDLADREPVTENLANRAADRVPHNGAAKAGHLDRRAAAAVDAVPPAVKENYKDLEVLIFVTPQKITALTAKDWAEEVRKKVDLQLYVMSREDIISSLTLPSNAALCGTLPGIRTPIEQDDAALLAKVREAGGAERKQVTTLRGAIIRRVL